MKPALRKYNNQPSITELNWYYILNQRPIIVHKGMYCGIGRAWQ